MRVLFVAGPTASNVAGLAPLAAALRATGHDVVVAATAEILPVVTGVGLHTVEASSVELATLLADHPATGAATHEDEVAAAGRRFGQLALAMAKPLYKLVGTWPPDLVVAGAHAYAGALAAVAAGVPWVRHAITANHIDRSGVHPGASDILAPELARLGADRFPAPSLMVDPFPASLRPAEAPTEQIAPIRWVPIDHPVTIEPWMLDASPRRTLLTAGSISSDYYDVDLIRSTAAALDGSTSEILVACPPEAAERLRGVHGITRAGQLPFKLLAPTLDLIVHHGGGLTALTALGAGVPQVILPLESKNADSAHRMCAAGAGVALPSSDASLADIGEVCRTLLEDRLARDRCRALATEMVAMPLPADVAGSLADRFVDVRSS